MIDNVKLTAKVTEFEGSKKQTLCKVKQMDYFLVQSNVEIQSIPVYEEENVEKVAMKK